MLRLHGFKRWFECWSLDYFAKHKGLTRHGIDCWGFAVVPTLTEADSMQNLVKFQEMDPTKIDGQYRSNMIKEILTECKSLEWSLYNFLTADIQKVASAYPTEVVNLTDIAKCVSKNIYEINRKTAHFNGFNFDNKLIEHEQEIMHNEWEEKTKEGHNVSFY